MKKVSQPYYVLLNHDQEELNSPVGYTPNVKEYEKFLAEVNNTPLENLQTRSYPEDLADAKEKMIRLLQQAENDSGN